MMERISVFVRSSRRFSVSPGTASKPDLLQRQIFEARSRIPVVLARPVQSRLKYIELMLG